MFHNLVVGVKYELMDLCEDSEMIPGLGLALKEYPIPKMLKEVDCFLPICSFKTHELAGVILAIKNIGIGTPSARVIGMCKFGLPQQDVACTLLLMNSRPLHNLQKILKRDLTWQIKIKSFQQNKIAI